MNTIFANKVRMNSAFTEAGKQAGVTILSVPPIKVLDIRSVDKHGYSAIRFAIQSSKRKITNRELRTDEVMEPGTEINIDETIKPGDIVKITGTSKGRGFTSVVKRHHFKGGPRTHGTSDRERAPGSSGQNMTPGRVYKGKRRSGHMGVDKISILGAKVHSVDSEKRIINVIGPVPGNARSGLLTITKMK